MPLEWFRSQECSDLLRIVIAAVLFFLISRSGDLLILVKRRGQRTRAEQTRVDRGLVRSTALEALVFVPASAYVLSLLRPLAISDEYVASLQPGERIAFHTSLGLLSYPLPYGAIKAFIKRVALNTLKEFHAIGPGAGAPASPPDATSVGGDV